MCENQRKELIEQVNMKIIQKPNQKELEIAERRRIIHTGYFSSNSELKHIIEVLCEPIKKKYFLKTFCDRKVPQQKFLSPKEFRVVNCHGCKQGSLDKVFAYDLELINKKYKELRLKSKLPYQIASVLAIISVLCSRIRINIKHKYWKIRYLKYHENKNLK